MMTSLEYAHMTADEWSRADVVAMEKLVAKAIDFDLDTCTSFEMVKPLLATDTPKKIHFLAEYLSDLSLLSSRLTCLFSAQTIAAACRVLA